MRNFIRITHLLTAADLGIVTTEAEAPASPVTIADEPHNIIYYGAPGTGKSWLVEQQAQPFENRVLRVTFYPDYSFSQFVGGYKPRSQYLEEATNKFYDTNPRNAADGTYGRRPVIDYVAVPGPLLTLLAQAYRHPEQRYLLIIEELNRANAAAVFGDLFQLLDRGTEGVSTYAATLADELANWLRNEGVPVDGTLVAEAEGGGLRIRLPNNFFVWATMNSADQGVQPLDAAFKRRWTFEYVPLNKQEAGAATWTMLLLGRTVSWNQLRRLLNDFLMKQASGGGRALVPEDRLLGPFFMKESELGDNLIVLNKLLLYLRDDLVRHNPGVLFAAGALHFSELYQRYLDLSAAVVPATDTAEAFRQDLEQLFVPALAAPLASLFAPAPAPEPPAPNA